MNRLPDEVDAGEVYNMREIYTDDGKAHYQFIGDWVSEEGAKESFCKDTEYEPCEVEYTGKKI